MFYLYSISDKGNEYLNSFSHIMQVTSPYLPLEIYNADVVFRDDCTTDEFIDVLVGNRVYMSCLYVSSVLTLLRLCYYFFF